jgi:hypothetical protein
MREITKKRIKSIVKAYRDIFPEQYRLGALGNRQRAANQKTKWGETLTSDILEREIIRMPTQLHTILYAKLTPEEIMEFETEKGTLWFTRTYPEWVPNNGKE